MVGTLVLIMPAVAAATSSSVHFTDPNPQPNDAFGYAVSISSDGNTAVVGSPQSQFGGNNLAGVAYVFVNQAGSWSEAARLTATDTALFSNFGASVAITPDGQNIIVGSFGNSRAYIFTEPVGGWNTGGDLTPQSELQLSGANAQSGDYFGWSVGFSADDSTAIVGAKLHGQNETGAAYIFQRQNTDWASTPTLNETTQLNPSDLSTNNRNSFAGYSVALSADGSKALVGAPGLNNNLGQAYEYTEPVGGWTSASTVTQTQTLIPSDPNTGDSFGQSVALTGDGNTAAIGSPAQTINGQFATGAVYVFTDSGDGNGLVQSFETTAAPQGLASDDDGFSVALAQDGSSLLVGAQAHSVNGNDHEGIAYEFNPANDGTGNWNLSQTFSPDADGPNQQFGFSVAVINNPDMGDVFIGAPGAPPQQAAGANATAFSAPSGSGGSSSGTAYLFDTTPPAISGLTPGTAGIGAEVSITGLHLAGATSVTFGGISATITRDVPNEVDVVVPAGVPTDGSSVPVTVTTPYGSDSSSFTGYPVPPPTISSFAPDSQGEGGKVTIKGGPDLTNVQVSLNGQALQVVKSGKKSISVNIPLNAVSGYLVVTNPSSPNSGSTWTTTPLTVPAPAPKSIPKSGSVGSTIEIKGQDMAGVTQVIFGGGITAQPVTASDKSVTVVVPAGAQSGQITVAAPSGQGTTAKSFTVL